MQFVLKTELGGQTVVTPYDNSRDVLSATLHSLQFTVKFYFTFEEFLLESTLIFKAVIMT
jgi:hypothetical protein